MSDRGPPTFASTDLRHLLFCLAEETTESSCCTALGLGSEQASVKVSVRESPQIEKDPNAVSAPYVAEVSENANQ